MPPAGPFKILAYGEILWDMLPTGPQLGGAPFNFAFRMASLGYHVTVVSRLGQDELGRLALSRIRELGLDPSYIQIDPEMPTGTVRVDVDKDGAPKFEIARGTAYDRLELTAELLSLAAQADCICFGTLIQRSLEPRFTLYALLDSAAGAIKLCDINLRQGCYTEETVRESIRRATILKLSEDEVNIVAQALDLDAKPLDRFCEQLLSDTRLAVVVITLADRGALAMSANGTLHYEPGWRVNVVDTCGSGDAFAAGFIHALLSDEKLDRACAVANAFGALVAETPGGTSPIEVSKIEELLRSQRERIIDEALAERVKQLQQMNENV